MITTAAHGRFAKIARRRRRAAGAAKAQTLAGRLLAKLRARRRFAWGRGSIAILGSGGPSPKLARVIDRDASAAAVINPPE
jgi:hypothetical protein